MPWALLSVAACGEESRTSDGLVGIYSAIVDSIRTEVGPSGMVLLDTAHLGLLSEAELNRLGATADLQVAYFVANRRKEAPAALLSDGLGLEVFDGARFPLADAEDPAVWWNRVTDHYGTTEIVFVHFGEAGVSPDGKEAVLNYEVSCGLLCRAWYAASLERQEASWMVKNQFMYQIN